MYNRFFMLHDLTGLLNQVGNYMFRLHTDWLCLNNVSQRFIFFLLKISGLTQHEAGNLDKNISFLSYFVFGSPKRAVFISIVEGAQTFESSRRKFESYLFCHSFLHSTKVFCFAFLSQALSYVPWRQCRGKETFVCPLEISSLLRKTAKKANN